MKTVKTSIEVPVPSIGLRPDDQKAIGSQAMLVDTSRRRLVAGALASLGSGPWLSACGGGTSGPATAAVTSEQPPSLAGLAPDTPQGQSSVPPPALTDPIRQFLTSDAGSAIDSDNISAPTRDLWHKRLGTPWKRVFAPDNALYGRGNWLDAGQVQEGTAAYGSSAALTSVGQVANINVVALVQRWMTNNTHCGFYLNARGSVWPIDFFGRTAPSAADRPMLTVVTSMGTFTLAPLANASWNVTTYRGFGTAAVWRLASGAQPAILRFDLGTITGTINSATLSFKVLAFDTGHIGHIVDVFECDPPSLTSLDKVPSPVLGLAANYASFNALKASRNPNLLHADDFSSPGPYDKGFTPSAPRTLNPTTGTTYARGTIEAGTNISLDARREVSMGTGPRGTPNLVYEELYSQYWLYLENDFGTTADTAIKIPAMGMQFGYWQPAGYWQQTTGNGGDPGTGLKVDKGGNSNYEYQGHSVRFVTGVSPTAADDDPYNGWFRIGIYPYNLDQGGPFPAGENFLNVVLRKEQWYCIDIRVKQNSMSGSQDALGNYATANGDGIYQTWINGHLVYSRNNYRWRRHAEFGVQGIWLDVYHGGVPVSPSTMHYRIDRVSVAKAYIGPPAP